MNMIGQSQSGTGKTAAFTLNILSRIDLTTPEMQQAPQALVLAPTRELARQIIGVIQVMGQFMTGLTVSAAIPVEQSKRGQPITGQIVVGTPGTTKELINKQLLNPQHIKILVLDEADNMLEEQGMGDQCMRVKM
jgi:ATP-dependent RNA helicase DDX19/DBP5